MDLGVLVAGRTCEEVLGAQGVDSKYSRGLSDKKLFSCDDAGSFRIFNAYRLTYTEFDGGLKVVLSRGGRVPQNVRDSLAKLRIPQSYNKSIKGISSDVDDSGNLVLLVRLSDSFSEDDQNFDKIFYAIHNVVTKPCLTVASKDVI